MQKLCLIVHYNRMHIPPTFGHYSQLTKGSNATLKLGIFYLFLLHTSVTEDRSKIIFNNMTLVSIPQPLEYEPQPDKGNPLSVLEVLISKKG